MELQAAESDDGFRTPSDEDTLFHSISDKIGNGCSHYKRRCKIRAPCCDQLFWCRHCHDAIQADADAPHKIDRFAVTRILCIECGLEQSVAKECQFCGVSFADYFCKVCKFWDDTPSKQIYHCDDCGICRIGARDDYFHCPTCQACYPQEWKNNHRCLTDALKDICCICHEPMFDSVRPVSVLRQCGHALHQLCFETYIQSGFYKYRCPLCNTPQRDIRVRENSLAREIDESSSSSNGEDEWTNDDLDDYDVGDDDGDGAADEGQSNDQSNDHSDVNSDHYVRTLL